MEDVNGEFFQQCSRLIFQLFFSNLGCISRLLLNSNRERKGKLKLRSTSELKIMRNAIFLSVTNRILSS